jgi:hypothetical protein
MYVGYGREPWRYKAQWTLGIDGVLTMKWGDGSVVYFLVRDGDPRASKYIDNPTADLSGEWYSVARATGHPNGDRYIFAPAGHAYKIIRNGKHGVGDNFAFTHAATVKHVHGPQGILQPNGDIFWDLDNNKWLSRREGRPPVTNGPPVVVATVVNPADRGGYGYGGGGGGADYGNSDEDHHDPNDPTRKLEKLKEMFDKSLITQAEYDMKKDDILRNI